MKDLLLPDQLKGPWEHLLILTYGADLPFFENALSRQLSPRCRNRIILMDGTHYLRTCHMHARDGLARQLNQRYVVDGIFAPRAAHAKVILLTEPTRGRLLLGSGNLGWTGYTSGGELFTCYDYSADNPGALPAFLAVRELVEVLVAQQDVGPTAARHLARLWEESPWILGPSPDDERPVRHNLTRSFLDQLREAVRGQVVEELWVLSPFYDRDAVAIERLLADLTPGRATLLLQPRRASVDPAALRRVLDRFGERCHVQPFAVAGNDCYAHAKLYLLKLSDRAICLQGSPNLTQVAMLRAGAGANIETANLLTGPRDAFDDILAVLTIGADVASLAELELSYQTDDLTEDEGVAPWLLTGGEWQGDILVLRYRGPLPALNGARLAIGHNVFPLELVGKEPFALRLRISAEAVALLSRAMPVRLRCGEDEAVEESNPIFACNRAALDAMLEVGGEDERLGRIGSLDLDDADFEQLLNELNAALMIDRQSVWQIVGRQPAASRDEDHEAPPLDYAAVDYGALRRHPKMQQYLHGPTGHGAARSRLQIILNSITDHFLGLADAYTNPRQLNVVATDLDEIPAQTEEEYEERVEEKARRHRSAQQRVKRLLKGFIGRYLRGIRRADFQQVAGYEVMAQNYIIFSHILWRLFAKDWVEHAFVVTALLDTWAVFWGEGEQPGYLASLSQDQRTQVYAWMRFHHSDAEMLAALYYSARVADMERLDETRVRLRDFCRAFLSHPPYEITGEIIEEMWLILAHVLPLNPPLPTTVVREWTTLARVETREGFCHMLAKKYGYPSGSWLFSEAKVYRPSLGRQTRTDCLVLRARDASLDEETAVAIVQEWMRFENRDYYRISTPSTEQFNTMLYYDVINKKGIYWAKSRREHDHVLDPITPLPAAWDTTLSQIMARARQVDAVVRTTGAHSTVA